MVEKLGIPTVSIIGSGFVKQAQVVIKGLGVPLAVGVYPGAPMVDSDAELAAKVEKNLAPELVAGLTRDLARPAAPARADSEPARGQIVFSGNFDEVQDYFHEQLWSDGLPVVPPTRERVHAFLEYTDRSADDVFLIAPPEGREASIYSIAVNGVMAGCRPEYMPVLIAIVEAMCDPNFRLEDAGSTPGWEPMVVVSGTIIKELNLNYGQGVMRAGRQANTSIGRFMRMYLRNVCGYRIPPGAGDKGSIGQNFIVALAEDEDSAAQLGWSTFGEDCGFAQGENAVTVQSVVCISPPLYSAGDTALGHVQQFTDILSRVFAYGCYSGVKRGFWTPLIIVGPGIAQVIAREWSKDKVKTYLWENMTIPASLMKHFCWQTAATTIDFSKLVEEGTLPERYAASDDPDRPIPMIVQPDHIGLVVAGDPERNQSRGYMSNNTQGSRTSRRVVLPKRWPELLARHKSH